MTSVAHTLNKVARSIGEGFKAYRQHYRAFYVDPTSILSPFTQPPSWLFRRRPWTGSSCVLNISETTAGHCPRYDGAAVPARGAPTPRRPTLLPERVLPWYGRKVPSEADSDNLRLIGTCQQHTTQTGSRHLRRRHGENGLTFELLYVADGSPSWGDVHADRPIRNHRDRIGNVLMETRRRRRVEDRRQGGPQRSM